MLFGAFPMRPEVYYLRMILPMTHAGAKSHRKKSNCPLARGLFPTITGHIDIIKAVITTIAVLDAVRIPVVFVHILFSSIISKHFGSLHSIAQGQILSVAMRPHPLIQL